MLLPVPCHILVAADNFNPMSTDYASDIFRMLRHVGAAVARSGESTGFQFPAREIVGLPSSPHPDRLWAHPASYSGGKTAES
jgi:hypothetical protein